VLLQKSPIELFTMLQQAHGEIVIKHLRYMTGMNVSMIDMITLTTVRIEVVHQSQNIE
jgi:hypothetical protein